MMKVKKLGAMLLASAMVITVLPQTAMAGSYYQTASQENYLWEDNAWSLTSQTTYQYDSSGKVTSRMGKYGESTNKYVYTYKKGRLNSITQYVNSVKKQVIKGYKYDSKGNVKQYTEYDASGNKVLVNKNTIKNGKIIKAVSTYTNGKKEHVATYYTNGNTKSYTGYYESGKKNFVRKYDKYGNETSYVNYDENGTKSRSATQVNTYSGSALKKSVNTSVYYNSDYTVKNVTTTNYYTSGAKLGWEKSSTEKQTSTSKNNPGFTRSYTYTYSTKSGKVTSQIVKCDGENYTKTVISYKKFKS